MKIVLASQSPRRRQLMELIGIEHIAVVSDVEETAPPDYTPDALVMELALQKARAVHQDYPDDCVIGADTVVFIDDEIIGKPADEAAARATLTRLQGREHIVYTGVAVLSPRGEDVRFEATRVRFSSMSDAEIAWYISTGEPMDKAGAYGIQGPGGMFVSAVNGNYFNVIGMPLPLLYRMLCDAGAMQLS